MRVETTVVTHLSGETVCDDPSAYHIGRPRMKYDFILPDRILLNVYCSRSGAAKFVGVFGTQERT